MAHVGASEEPISDNTALSSLLDEELQCISSTLVNQVPESPWLAWHANAEEGVELISSVSRVLWNRRQNQYGF